MIVCVTLNPCLDKTLSVPAWKPGDSVRGLAVREVVGGKGNNVARALTRLGRTARPATFLGGAVGARCEALIRDDDQLNPLITPTASSTREILTVRTEGTSEQSAFFDPDPVVTPAEAEALFHRIEGAFTEGGVEALTLSGSSPSASTHGLYSDLIALALSRKVPVFLDSYGPALDHIWGFWPKAIQVNRREAGIRLRKPNPTDADVIALLKDWSSHGVSCGVITDGPNPAFVRLHGLLYCVTPARIEMVNPIGSGDCLLAGMVDAWLNELPPEGMIRQAFACAAANAMVWDAGGISEEEVERQREGVRIEAMVL